MFTWPAAQPQLIGSRCGECAAVTFPAQGRCPRCGKQAMDETLLPRTGTLVTWTTQGFPPVVGYAGDETGKCFEPFGVGLVQLDDVVRVEAKLTESDPAKLRFGMDVELAVVPFYVDDDGDEIMTFAFAPAGAARKPIPEEEILASPVLNHPLTAYMFCAPDEGAAAVVMCRADIADRYTETPIHVRASEIRTRNYGAYEVNTTWAAVDEDVSPTVYASRAAYEAAGVEPEDVDVIQLQDTDAGAEVIHMAENGFCADGEQEKLIADGATEIGGPLPVNTDGGLIANGEPIGASGLRQMHELVLQLRGQAGDRQVAGDPQVGYAQVYGAPGTAAVTILSR
jgi:uncharacterized OB-fold protein